MAKKDIHIVPRDDKWAVQREGASRASSIHDRKSDAVDAGRETARRERTELVTHCRNGRIHDSDSYGGGPFPPRDRKR